MITEILTFGFMQRALITGVAIAIICSIMGLFLVLKRQSLFGDALSHVAFGGIAVGLFTNIYPLWTAFIISVLAAIGMTKLRESTKIPADSAVAVLLSSGLAIGLVLISISSGFNLDLFSFLFGSILLVSENDMALILIVTAGILLILSLIYKKLVYVTFDEEQAEAAGIRVRSINYLFIILSSITVIASIKLVGVLLISSLIVLPNVTALTLRKGFRTTTYISCIISSGSVILGIIVSYIANISPSGAIVLTNTAIFFSFLVGRYLKRKSQNSKFELTAPKSDI